MHEQLEDDTLNIKVILLGVGGAAVAALLLALARHEKEEKSPAARAEEVAARAEHVVADVKRESRKAAKAAKKKRKEMAAAAEETGHRVAGEVREAAAHLGFDAKSAERDLKAAAWDAHLEAKEAESRLRAAGHRVVDDATQLASWVGTEARTLAGEGKEKIAHLRHREEAEGAVDREVERLRAEVEELRGQLGKAGRRAEKDYRGLTSRFTGKSGPVAEVMASQATAAALEQIERSLRAKAPALLAARNRAQVMEILQQELGSTLRDTAVQAAVAALGKWESGRDTADEARDHARSATDDVRARARHAADEARDAARGLGDEVREKARHLGEEARDAGEKAVHRAESIESNGKRHWGRAAEDVRDAAADADETTRKVAESAKNAEPADDEHRGKAGLFWGGAGIGLALYALLDAERRDKVLRFANEASVQVQELVRDLQGYDDEF